ncbi:MAG: Glucose-phosphate adenylyltransferase [Planctomycetaceae bacterium]|nr:Glucose-phosphate adenylyltransferase [Planctomycetaceae bacterium]
MSEQVLSIILAGGKGTRLEPLTNDRAKPAVPFAGAYRIIDFPLSNCFNSGYFQILVLTQYKSLSLYRHLDMGWKSVLPRELGAYLEVVPPQQRIEDEWYRGTADAVYQNIYSIDHSRSDYVLILAGDHIYTMDYREMVRFHIENRADVTVGAYRVPIAEAAGQFGVIQIARDQRVVGFQEKPLNPTPIPGDAGHTLASMGIYVFSTSFLVDTLCRNAGQPNSGHDFGHHILPAIYPTQRVFAYPFSSPGNTASYWRDVGTLDAYYLAHRDLLNSSPPLDLYNRDWPIRSFRPNLPPPVVLSSKCMHSPSCSGTEQGVRDSLICPGTKIDHAEVSESIIGYDTRIGPRAVIEECILLGGIEVGSGAHVRRTIIDKHVKIPAGARIGFDPEEDRANGFTVSEAGITVVPRGRREH